MQCIECGSSDVKSLGTRLYGPVRYTKYECSDCGEHMLISPDSKMEEDEEFDGEGLGYKRDQKFISELESAKKIVVSCVQNNSAVNHKFLGALEKYCDIVGARLVLIPIRYKNNDGDVTSYAPEIEQYLVDNTIKLKSTNLKILGSLKIAPTAENPLSGLDPMSKGSGLIIGHPQVMMKTLPQHSGEYPPIITTTGTITEKNYIQSKLGFKAEFNHSMSAVVIEQSNSKKYHIRHLNFDGDGFCDLGIYYTEFDQCRMKTLAIVTGDEHVMFFDQKVADATYFSEDSLVNVLKPEIIVRHDVLDSYAVSHHHKKNIFTRFAKWHSGSNDIMAELDKTIKFINDTTPEYSKTWIVSSNHNDHLFRWLNECDPKIEPWNALIYHRLMYEMLARTKMGDSGAECPDPFELYAKNVLKDNVEFLARRGCYRIADIEVGYHGDVGTNGSRGSRQQFSVLPTKTIIGHSHSPGITRGSYQVGTSSQMAMEYNKGPSSWHQAHCVVYGNGKRQMIFITDGEYRG